MASVSPRFVTVTPTPTRIGRKDTARFPSRISFTRRRNNIVNAIEEGKEEKTLNLSANETTIKESNIEKTLEEDELGSKIKEEMMKRKGVKEESLWSGVAEEIKEIEWPAFGKVLGITGVVLGVIAGSSVVLLTVNAVLAELSDQIFVGRGVQDFFG